MRPEWREVDSRCLPAHEFPATLVDVALTRDIEPDRLLRGTGIFLEDLLGGQLVIRPQQVLQLIARLRKLVGPEAPFLAGQRLLPGNFGPVSTALVNATNLAEALRLIERHSPTLSPLMSARLQLDGEYAELHWRDSFGAADGLDFLTLMMMSAVQSGTRWLSGQPLPWQFELPETGADPAALEVNLGPGVQTGRFTRRMRIERRWLRESWPRGCPSVARVAAAQADELTSLPGFIDCVDQQLRLLLPSNPSLERLAEHLGMSPATLKRKLKKHRTSFQKRFDLVRRELAVDWLTRQHLSLTEIARRLHFHDARNLRRAFKRWTGHLPTAVQSARSPH